MLRTSLMGGLIGVVLGFLCGAIMTWLLPTNAGGPDTDSVNMTESVDQSTGKPQIHLQGKPPIKK